MAIRICHVTSVHPAKDIRIFHKECKSLAKAYDVYLVAPNIKDEFSDGVHLVGVNLPKGRLKRLFCLGRVYKKAKEIDADLYHFHDPELMRLGLKIKKLGKKVIFDSHEDIPQQILTKEYLPSWAKTPISRLYSKVEIKALSKYNALISVTPFIVERLSKINPRTVMVTNYPDVNDIIDNKTVEDFKERDCVCFAGGVSKRYMHENVIASLEFTKARYLVVGPAYPSYLEMLKHQKMWEKVDYKGFVEHDEVSELFKRAFAGIVLLDYSPNVGYHKGTLGVLKMFEYMIAGLPVIATDLELWKEIIEGNGCGICINPHDIHSIADAINFYHNNPEIAQQHGERGRRAVIEKYNWSTQERVLFDLYKECLRN